MSHCVPSVIISQLWMRRHPEQGLAKCDENSTDFKSDILQDENVNELRTRKDHCNCDVQETEDPTSPSVLITDSLLSQLMATDGLRRK